MGVLLVHLEVRALEPQSQQYLQLCARRSVLAYNYRIPVPKKKDTLAYCTPYVAKWWVITTLVLSLTFIKASVCGLLWLWIQGFCTYTGIENQPPQMQFLPKRLDAVSEKGPGRAWWAWSQRKPTCRGVCLHCHLELLCIVGTQRQSTEKRGRSQQLRDEVATLRLLHHCKGVTHPSVLLHDLHVHGQFVPCYQPPCEKVFGLEPEPRTKNLVEVPPRMGQGGWKILSEAQNPNH